MEILRTISFYAEAKGIPFLLIGGHAVCYYGLSRQTGDIDLLVKREDKSWWRELFQKLDYGEFQQDEFFARFQSQDMASWPIDLMFVDLATFQKMDEAGLKTHLGVAEVRVVSARHLAVLKIHALKHYQEHRFAKDYNDLLWLLRSGKTAVTVPELKDLCGRYADENLYLKIMGEWIQNGKN